MTAEAAGDALARRLVPDVLWQLAAPLIPGTARRPQGGGRRRVDDRAILAAVLFVIASGCSWRGIPDCLGVAVPTAYRRFVEWHDAGLWQRLDAEVRRQVDGPELAAWTGAIVAAAPARAALRELPMRA
ncbi:MAG: transposase [Sciscionella sp.]